MIVPDVVWRRKIRKHNAHGLLAPDVAGIECEVTVCRTVSRLGQNSDRWISDRESRTVNEVYGKYLSHRRSFRSARGAARIPIRKRRIGPRGTAPRGIQDN